MQIIVWSCYAIVTIAAALIGLVIGAVIGLFAGPAQLFAWLSNGDSSDSTDTI